MLYSLDEISEKIDENEQKIAEAMNRAGAANVRDLTDDEKRQLAAGDITKEEAVRLLVDDAAGRFNLNANADASIGGNTSENTSGNASSNIDAVTAGNTAGNADTNIDAIAGGIYDADIGGTSVSDGQSDGQAEKLSLQSSSREGDTNAPEAGADDVTGIGNDSDSEAKLAELIAEAYVLRAYYTNRLEGMRSSAAAEFKSLNANEQTRQNQLEIGMKYMNMAGTLEAECDGLMDDLIARIASELALTGGDSTITGEIRVCYAEEKSLKKAYYLSLYG